MGLSSLCRVVWRVCEVLWRRDSGGRRHPFVSGVSLWVRAVDGACVAPRSSGGRVDTAVIHWAGCIPGHPGRRTALWCSPVLRGAGADCLATKVTALMGVTPGGRGRS